MADSPTEEKLAQLPNRAIAAYAVRSAMRVRPLYNGPGFAAVNGAIRISQAYAGGAEISSTEAEAAANAAEAAANAEANAAAFAAAFAAKAAGVFAAEADDDDAVKAADNAGEAAMKAAEIAAKMAGVFAADDSANADFDELKALADEGVETFDTSESGPLGPLWPDGEPEWYREAVDQQGGESLEESEPFEFLMDTGDATKEEITALFSTMSDLFRALGGDCDLQFTVEETRKPAEVLA